MLNFEWKKGNQLNAKTPFRSYWIRPGANGRGCEISVNGTQYRGWERTTQEAMTVCQCYEDNFQRRVKP